MQESTLYSVRCRAFNTMCVISVLRIAEKEIYMCDKIVHVCSSLWLCTELCDCAQSTVHCALCIVRSELCNVQSRANDPRCLLLQFSTHLSHSFAATWRQHWFSSSLSSHTGAPRFNVKTYPYVLPKIFQQIYYFNAEYICSLGSALDVIMFRSSLLLSNVWIVSQSRKRIDN